MAKVFVGVGHGGSDPGAVGYIVEKDANLVMATACAEMLKAHGVTVKMSRTRDESESLTGKINECNAFKPDLAIDVHNNAGGGDGWEAIHSINGGTGKTLAKNIETEIKKIGQNSRGLKTRKNSSGTDYFGFIRSTNCPAVILEGAFVDNATDVKIADTAAEQKEFGKAYARGILKTLGISVSEETISTKNETKTETVKNESFKVRVSIHNLNIRKGPGTNYARTGQAEAGVYTIVDVKDGQGSAEGWGKLKSGAGWIALDYATRL